MSGVSQDIAKGINVVGMFPTVSKLFFLTLDDLRNLGQDGNKAFTYYDGMEAYCLEDRSGYEWKQLSFGENGVVPGGFTYPPGTIVNAGQPSEQDYSGKNFNFVLKNYGNNVSENLFFKEPSVNIEFKEGAIPQEAMYFGELDMGNGFEEAALIKNSFVSQSGYDIKSPTNIGDELKMFDVTTLKYLGHFKTTDQTYQGYHVLEIIEPGEWSPVGNYNTQEIVIHVVKENLYDLSLSGNNLQLKKGPAVVKQVDLSPFTADDVIVSGSFESTTGTLTFETSQGNSIPVDLSDLLLNANVNKEENLSSKSSDVYENLFVTKSMFAPITGGFYSGDLQTNYNSTSIAGYPYPSNIQHIVLRYYNRYYLLVRNNSPLSPLMNNTNNVIGMSFFKYKDAGKSMKKIAYIKVLAFEATIPGLNSNFKAYPLWTDRVIPNFPSAATGGKFNEQYLQQYNELNAIGMAVNLYQENTSSNRILGSGEYTLRAGDHGKIIVKTGSGNIRVPSGLPAFFECGVINMYSAELRVLSNSGVSLSITAGRTDSILVRGSIYIMANQQLLNGNGQFNTFTSPTSYIVNGDLKQSE